MLRITEEDESAVDPLYSEVVKHLLSVMNIVDRELGSSLVASECHKKMQELVFWIQHGINLKKEGELV